MRLIPRHHRHGNGGKAPKVAISAEEIAADLHYPAQGPPPRRRTAAARGSR
jgi:hypothetical protein